MSARIPQMIWASAVLDAPPRDGVETIRVIMKDGVIYKNTLGGM